MGQETLTLSRAELKKVVVVEKILSGHMTNAEGAAVLGLTCRQVIRLKKKYLTEAKGRIERLWGTLQDRMVIELRLLGVNTIEQANAALPALLLKHNRRFAVKPKKDDCAYMKLDPSTCLEYVFTTREKRTLGQGHTLSYANKLYTFAKPKPAASTPRRS